MTAIGKMVIVPTTRMRAEFWYGYLVAAVTAFIGIAGYYIWRLN